MKKDETQEIDYICEGKAKIFNTNNVVFYNPAQVLNRDLSIIGIKSFLNLRKRNISVKNLKKLNCNNFEGNYSEEKHYENNTQTLHLKTTILEPLGASGLRSIRYLKELSSEIDYLVCGDIDPLAISRMEKNFELNSIPKEKYTCICADARRLLSFSTPKLIKEISLRRENNSGVDDIVDYLLRGRSGFKHLSNDDVGFTVVDIDPYGTCTPFIDGTLNSCEEDGLACFTATDMPVLCGNVPEVTFYRYGGNPLKRPYVHEMSLRLLLNRIITTGAKYQKSVIPMLSISVDFYVRLFVKVKTSATNCKDISSSTGLVFQCTNCPSFYIVNFGEKSKTSCSNNGKAKRKRENENSEVAKAESFCRNQDNNNNACNHKHYINEKIEKDLANNKESCGTYLNNVEQKEKFKYKVNQLNIKLYNEEENKKFIRCKECMHGKYCIGGPIYTGKLHDEEFVSEMLNYCDEIENNCNDNIQGISMHKKIKGLLTAVKEELNDSVLHYHIPSLCNFLGIEAIKPILFHSALRNLGYKSSHFHRDPLSLKTNAPNKVVLDILRTWALLNPSKNDKNSSFLSVKVETEGIKIEIHPDVLLKMKANSSIPRWLPNPESNWGPISKPKKR